MRGGRQRPANGHEQKGRNVFVSTPVRHLTVVSRAENAAEPDLLIASTLPHRLRLLDRRFVVPAAAACSLVHGRRTLSGCGLGLIIATSAECRAAPGRELVDPGGSLIQTRIHFISPG